MPTVSENSTTRKLWETIVKRPSKKNLNRCSMETMSLRRLKVKTWSSGQVNFTTETLYRWIYSSPLKISSKFYTRRAQKVTKARKQSTYKLTLVNKNRKAISKIKNKKQRFLTLQWTWQKEMASLIKSRKRWCTNLKLRTSLQSHQTAEISTRSRQPWQSRFQKRKRLAKLKSLR